MSGADGWRHSPQVLEVSDHGRGLGKPSLAAGLGWAGRSEGESRARLHAHIRRGNASKRGRLGDGHGMVSKDEWRATRLKYIREHKEPSDQQRLLLDLVDQPSRTAAEERDLAALWTAEKAAEKHQLAQIKAGNMVTGRKDAASKARNHKMFQAAGLMGLAGLLDTKTGELARKPAALLGALLGLAEVDDPRRWEAWESKGAPLLAERSKKGSRK